MVASSKIKRGVTTSAGAPVHVAINLDETGLLSLTVDSETYPNQPPSFWPAFHLDR